MLSGESLLNGRKFKILKLQPIADVCAEGQQSDGYFGDHAGVVILDKGVIPADIDDGAEHGASL